MTRYVRTRPRNGISSSYRSSKAKRLMKKADPRNLIIAFLRFLCFVPLGVYVFSFSLPYYIFMKKRTNTLLLPPLGRYVLLAEGLAGVGVSSIFLCITTK